jgi:outer membrane protein assembly factor BamB
MVPGQVCGLAAPGPDGPVFVTSYDGKNLSATMLTALGLDGGVLWRRTFDGHPGPPRVSGSGTVWISHRGPASRMLTELDASGTVVREVVLEHEPSEHLGAFAVLSDGICASWLPAGRGHLVPPGRHARVARHGLDGSCRWSAPAAMDQVQYPARVLADDRTGWEERTATWTPRTVEAHHWEPLLVSGHRVAATFADGGSGIAVTFFLDTSTGQLIATSRPGPSHHKAISGPGAFLIGFQGYRPSRTSCYDEAGAVTQEWPTHAMLLIGRDGHISGPESENVMPSRSHYVALEPDGTVHRGPALPGYYTSYPALDSNGTAVFWRAGRLHAIGRDLQEQVLFTREEDNRAVISKIMLLRDGQVAFAVHDELTILSRTGLGPLDSGIWPCADGGLRGNPVLH